MMRAFLLLVVLYSSSVLGRGFIVVPNEFPLLTQLIYTQIPPVRIGIDSKVGFGFRIGRNSDYQVVFEIGPQENRIDNVRSVVN